MDEAMNWLIIALIIIILLLTVVALSVEYDRNRKECMERNGTFEQGFLETHCYVVDKGVIETYGT